MRGREGVLGTLADAGPLHINIAFCSLLLMGICQSEVKHIYDILHVYLDQGMGWDTSL